MSAYELGQQRDDVDSGESWTHAFLTAPVFQTLAAMFLVTLVALGIRAGQQGPLTVALGPPLLDPWWQPITATYGHGSWGHFFSNAVVVALFGLIVAQRSSTIRFHLFFLSTGILSSVVQVAASNAVDRVVPVVVIGSSGAGFALIGYTLGLLFAGTLRGRASKRIILGVVGGCAAVLTVFFSPPESAILSHFTGAVLGLVAGWLGLLSWSIR